MHNDQNIIVLEKPDTSKFVVYGQSTTSQYITYTNSSSLIPSSFDQIMKNNTIILVTEEVDLMQSESSGKAY